MTSAATVASEAKRAPAGSAAEGGAIETVALTNKAGLSARVLTYGATLQSVMAPDRDGKLADVLLGYDKAEDYVNHPNFFGVTVGRFANRIGGGRFTLDGKRYQLPLNDKVNMLHDGTNAFVTKHYVGRRR